MQRHELIEAAAWIVALAVIGVLLGLVWSYWVRHSSQPGSVVFSTQIGNIPDEREGFVAADGRFAALTGVVGLLAGVVAWLRRRSRGAVVAAGLAVGGVVGALLTAWVGHLVSTGRTSAPVNQAFIAKTSLHAHGLIVLEAGLALLVYLICVLIIGSDALGRERLDRPAAAPWPVS